MPKATIRLLNLKPASNPEPVEWESFQTDLQDAPAYIICAGLMKHRSTGFEPSPELLSEVNEALGKLRHPEKPVRVWMEQLCIDNESTEDIANHMDLRKDIHSKAGQVFIWAGQDHEADDQWFDVYLGPGNPETTSHAFGFAHRLAAAEISEVPAVLDSRFSDPLNTHSWAYLFRILCRPFFRRLPLMRTNYVALLSSVVVRCSDCEIAFSTLFAAAFRIYALFPTPYFILNADYDNHEEGEMFVAKADCQLLEASFSYGVDPLDFLARMFRILENSKPSDEPSSSEEENSRLAVHLGICMNAYDGCGMAQYFEGTRSLLGKIEADPVARAKEVLHPEAPSSWPSLRFEGPSVPVPRAADQAPFVHFPLNRHRTISLVRLLPAAQLSDPIQCDLIECPLDDELDFYFIENAATLRVPLLRDGLTERQSPVTTRSAVPILVNGQAFIISRLQEVFLRLFRNSTEGRLMFLLNFCYYPQEATATPENMGRYFLVKRIVTSGTGCPRIDMYSVLDEAAQERSPGQLTQLGLPEGMSWDEWLLELND